MATVVLDPPPAELLVVIERRRRDGVDRFDEVWEGVLHMIPAPSFEHAMVISQVMELLGPPARVAGLIPGTGGFNLGESAQDYRVPDGGLVRAGTAGVWLATAALVVEVLSPDDETLAKLTFYARHDVDEVLIADPAEHSMRWLALDAGEYRDVERSRLIELGRAELLQRIAWP